MVIYEYEQFESWFNEVENYSFRSEQLFQHLELLTSERERREFCENWLRAAFDCGRLETT